MSLRKAEDSGRLDIFLKLELQISDKGAGGKGGTKVPTRLGARKCPRDCTHADQAGPQEGGNGGDTCSVVTIIYYPPSDPLAFSLPLW